GKPLEERLSPWLLVDTILHYRADSRAGASLIQRRRMDWLVRSTTVLLIWVAGPFVQGAAWWRIIPANAEWRTMWLGLLFGLTCYVGLETWLRLRRRLGYASPWQKRLTLTRRSGPVLATALIIVSWLATEGGTYRYTLPLIQHFRPASFDAVENNLTHRQMRRFDLKDESTWPGFLVDSYAPSHLDGPYLRVWQSHEALMNFGPLKFYRILGDARLSNVSFATLPPEAVDPLVARHRYRQEYCDRLGIPLAACGRAPSSEVTPPAYEPFERAKFCERNGTSDTCIADFARMDREFIEEWTAFREQVLKAVPKPDLTGRDLRKAIMIGAELAGVNMANANLLGANLSFAQMEGAVLSFAQMRGAILSGAQMEGADLRGAQIEGADLTFAQIEGANLSLAQMEGAVLRDAQLEGAVLSGAQMEGAILRGAQLEGADLTFAQLEGANLSFAQMEGAVLRDAQLEGAVLSRAQIEGAILSGAQLEGADLRGAQMEGAVLSRARMEGAVLSRARMEGAVLSRARMTSVFWSRATLRGALLQNTVLTGARGLTQEQLEGVIGDDGAVLPAALPPFRVASCWEEEPDTFEKTLTAYNRLIFFNDLTPEEARAEWLCSQDNPKVWHEGPLP
ncbi:MAG: pentapeptide repeat-containing protein, partial [Pseudomonadota bacterium]